MSNEPSTTPPQSDIHHVWMEGCFGSTIWTPPEKLYSVMPRAKRDALLDYTGTEQITPHLVELTGRILRHLDSKTELSALDSSYSLEDKEFDCGCFGKLVWQVGQGVWDVVPAADWETIHELVNVDLHGFMAQKIILPLMMYSAQQF